MYFTYIVISYFTAQWDAHPFVGVKSSSFSRNKISSGGLAISGISGGAGYDQRKDHDGFEGAENWWRNWWDQWEIGLVKHGYCNFSSKLMLLLL